jgi:hypothetical protein
VFRADRQSLHKSFRKRKAILRFCAHSGNIILKKRNGFVRRSPTAKNGLTAIRLFFEAVSFYRTRAAGKKTEKRPRNRLLKAQFTKSETNELE